MVFLIYSSSILSFWPWELKKKITKHLYRDQILVLFFLQIGSSEIQQGTGASFKF